MNTILDTEASKVSLHKSKEKKICVKSVFIKPNRLFLPLKSTLQLLSQDNNVPTMSFTK